MPVFRVPDVLPELGLSLLVALFSSETFQLHFFPQGLLFSLDGLVVSSLWCTENRDLNIFFFLHYLDLDNLTYLHLYWLSSLFKEFFYSVCLCGGCVSARESRRQRRPEEGVRYTGAECRC